MKPWGNFFYAFKNCAPPKKDLPQTSHSFQTFMQSPTLSTLYLYPISLTKIKKLISDLQTKKKYRH